MNKVFKFSVMASLCALFAAVPASLVLADEILCTDNSDSFRIEEDILYEEIIEEDIILEEEISSGGGGTEEDLLLDESTPEDGGGRGGNEEIIGTSPVEGDDGTPVDETPGNEVPGNGSEPAPGSGSELMPGVTADMQATLDEINKARVRAGSRRLTFSSSLNRAAAARVKETTVKFSHTRPNGRAGVSILRDFNIDYDSAGENIACSVYSPEAVVAAWSASPTHKRCMLNNDYSKAGIGMLTVNGYTYWVLLMTD